VLLAASVLAQKGLRVAVVSRGYKRKEKSKQPIVLTDQSSVGWQEVGDEPFMMSRLLKNYKVPVVIAANRVRACYKAMTSFNCQVILLDDGLQHHKLQRDANIILVDAKNPFGNRHLLPYGILREPVSGLARASLVLLTHCEQATEQELKAIEEEIRIYNPRVPVLQSVHAPQYYMDVFSGKQVPLESVSGGVSCFSALGHPETFENTLFGLGLTLKQKWRFADHHQYTEEDLRTLQQTRGQLPLITTFKDWVKFPENWRDILKKDVYVLAVNLRICGNQSNMDKFERVLFPAKK
jgi:tetraacyldisaccharide 4'-kinase